MLFYRDSLLRKLEALVSQLPERSAEWVRAMLAEAPQPATSWEFLSWLLGTTRVALRLSLRESLSSSERPISISATSLYLFAFSGYLLGHTLRQIPSVREPWCDAWFPVVACLCLTLLPAVIAFGLWASDNLARRLAIAFAALDLGQAFYFTYSQQPTPFRAAKILCDLVIVLLMFSSAARNACRWSVPSDRPIKLSN